MVTMAQTCLVMRKPGNPSDVTPHILLCWSTEIKLFPAISDDFSP